MAEAMRAALLERQGGEVSDSCQGCDSQFSNSKCAGCTANEQSQDAHISLLERQVGVLCDRMEYEKLCPSSLIEGRCPHTFDKVLCTKCWREWSERKVKEESK